MATNTRCKHLQDRRTKMNRTQPSIILRIAGTTEGFQLCPSCYDIILRGGQIEMTMSSRNNRTYKTRMARESDPPFVELRTELINK